MFSTYEFAQSLVSGLMIGGVYAVLGVGFSLTWGITKVINIAHAAFAVLAAYIAYWSIKSYGIDPVLSLVFIVPAFFLVGVGLHELVMSRVARKTQHLEMASMVLTFGLAGILENSMSVVWATDPRVLTAPYSGQSFQLSLVSIPITHAISFSLSMLTIATLYWFLHYTYVGRAVTAVWQDRDGAALSGVDLRRVTSITYGVALAAAGVGGVAMSLVYSFMPSTHLLWLIFVFLVVIFGGVGSVLGAALGGLIIGLVTGVTGTFIQFAWVNLVMFGLLILVLLVKPKGLMRR